MKKSVCDCCGYQTLFGDEPGEVCPVCCWEENWEVGWKVNYDFDDDLFTLDDENQLMLYQAQENYKAFSCCNKKMILRCRKPFKNEKKDPNWYSFQEAIEKKYDLPKLAIAIIKCCKHLKIAGSEIMYQNFKSLYEIDIEYNGEGRELGFDENIEFDQYKHELKLKSLSIALRKKDQEKLIKIFGKYYQNGLDYYISWSIILIVLTSTKQVEFDDEIINILLDIENNEYYGLVSLETVLKQYWLMKQ